MINAFKSDPSRTSTLRLRFLRDLKKRLDKIKKDTVSLLLSDPFGLDKNTVTFNQVNPNWQYLTSDSKLKEFQKWFKEQVDSGLLETVGDFGEEPWLAEYVRSAYIMGINRAYLETKKKALADKQDIWDATRAEFVATMLALPRTVQSIKLMYLRTFETLKGIDAEMSSTLSRILAGGLAHGLGARELSREVSNALSSISRKRAETIVRTEIIHAHAEASLDAYERLGVFEVGLEVEWSTAGDHKVCKACIEMSKKGPYTLEKARNLIPLHPRCRCAWTPYIER